MPEATQKMEGTCPGQQSPRCYSCQSPASGPPAWAACPGTLQSGQAAGGSAAHRSAARGAGSATETRPPRAGPGIARHSVHSQRTPESCWQDWGRRFHLARRQLGWREGCRKRGQPGRGGLIQSQRQMTASCWAALGRVDGCLSMPPGLGSVAGRSGICSDPLRRRTECHSLQAHGPRKS